MSGRKLITLLAALIIILLPARSAHAIEEILDWHSNITVLEDSSLLVVETIKVRAEGLAIKRGIFRKFPTTYQDHAGNRTTVDFTLLAVHKDGLPEPYHTKKAKNGIVVYAGQKDVFLDPGVYTYQLFYETGRQLGHFEDHDELYWNVTGNGWNFDIQKAEAVITLPESVTAADLRITGYTGPQGSREKNLTWHVTEEGRIVFTCDRPLGSFEGMTIVLGWPKGQAEEPTLTQKVTLYLLGNRNYLIALAGLATLLVYYLVVWWQVGRDPDKGTIIPLFDPPDNLSPAAMRYIMTMKPDNEGYASAVINLAVKGYLTISEKSKSLGFSRVYTLKRTGKEPNRALSKGEKRLARNLFAENEMSLKLESENSGSLLRGRRALRNSLVEEYQKSSFINNSIYMIIGAFISIAFILLMGRGMEGNLILILVIAPLATAAFYNWASKNYPTAAVFTFFLLNFLYFFSMMTPMTLPAFIVVIAAINMIFLVLLQSPTKSGRKTMDRITGFKMYLKTAEEHRFGILHPPEKTPELFERYLPYALALGVSHAWSEKFSDVLSKAAKYEGYSPDWYDGDHWDSMNAGTFGSSLGASMSSAISSALESPGSSSGFDSGGSSGGGGGGGGGGGW